MHFFQRLFIKFKTLFVSSGLVRKKYLSLKRRTPYSQVFGLDRGLPIDRQYIQTFLTSHHDLIYGHILEFGDNTYTLKYSGNITSSTIMAGPSRADRAICLPQSDLTVIKSLGRLHHYDCIICTNVLNFIYDIESATRGLASLVNPVSGHILATVSGISQVSSYDASRWGDYWRLTHQSAETLFSKYFNTVSVTTYGNAPLSAAFLMGVSVQELPRKLFDYNDPCYPITIAISAQHPKAKYA